MQRRIIDCIRASTCGVAIATATLIGVAPALAQTKPAAAPVAEEPEIVVSGIRRSLEQAAEIKRDAAQVLDVITSEDVGKLPDDNVAEALQRVTGVQITRVFGEGQSVSIRGLQQVRVEVDGRTLLGFSARVSPPENDNLGRSSGLDSVPSSTFGRLEVRKSPLASQAEGGLGGTVNLVTPKAFDFKKTTLSIRAQGTYSDGSEKFEPTFSGLFTTKIADGRIGILLSGEYQKRTSSLQTFERNNFFNRRNGGTTVLQAPQLLQYENIDIDRTRYGVNGSVQFQVSDNFVVTADALFSKVESARTNQFIAFRLGNSATATIVTNPTIVNNVIVAGTASGTLTQASQIRKDPTASYLAGLNGKFDDGKLKIEADAYFSRGTLRQEIEVITLQARTAVLGNFDFRNSTIPSLTLGTAAAPFDPSNFANYNPASQGIRANLLPANLEELTGRFDVSYKFDNDVTVQTGVRYVDLSADSQAFRSRATPPGADLLPFLTTSNASFLSGIPGNFPRAFVTAKPNRDFILTRALVGEPSLDPNAPAGTLRRNQQRDYDLTEKTFSGYLMISAEGEIFGIPAKANAGIRISSTRFEVDTFLEAPVGVFRARNNKNQYTNFLPSANVVFNVTDDFLVRVSSSRTLQRAGIAELAPSTFVNETNRTANGGNADLIPPISNNADISFEYYTNKSSLISGAIFYKTVKNFLASNTILDTFPGFERLGPIPSTRPANVASAEVKGFEIGAQQFFSFLPAPFDGLGVIANYTYSDAKDSNGFPLVAVSKNSYNLIGLFEKGPVSARLAYNYRSAAVFEFTEGRPDVIGARSQLDAQLGFDIAKGFSISLQAQNLIPKKSATVEFSNFNQTALNSYALSERRFSIGLRAKF